jgi:hypothetical protein
VNRLHFFLTRFERRWWHIMPRQPLPMIVDTKQICFIINGFDDICVHLTMSEGKPSDTRQLSHFTTDLRHWESREKTCRTLLKMPVFRQSLNILRGYNGIQTISQAQQNLVRDHAVHGYRICCVPQANHNRLPQLSVLDSHQTWLVPLSLPYDANPTSGS